MEKVNLAGKFAQFDEYFQPKIIGELNGQHVKIAKVKGDFVWHQHEAEDEMFLVLSGVLTIQLRDRDVVLSPGELFIVARGVEHRPFATEETHIMLFEPAGTINTGNAPGALTVENPERI
ncbi:MAG: cupin domain-containing protein [Acidobacteriota bacterium]